MENNMLPKRRVLFIDSALPDEIRTALSEGFQGVTTNPSLVAKAPKGDSSKPFMDRYLDHMRSIIEICNKYPLRNGSPPSLSVEVFSLEPEEMIKQANQIKEGLQQYEGLAIKIPVSYKGRNYLEVIKRLARNRFCVNATCGFSASQLELAAQAGARYVSLFYNRLIDHLAALMKKTEEDERKAKGIEEQLTPEQLEEYEIKRRKRARNLALRELRETREYLDGNSLDCEIILGSIRKPYDVTNGWKNGADIVTACYKVIPGMMNHSATDESVAGFDKDLKEWLK